MNMIDSLNKKVDKDINNTVYSLSESLSLDEGYVVHNGVTFKFNNKVAVEGCVHNGMYVPKYSEEKHCAIYADAFKDDGWEDDDEDWE